MVDLHSHILWGIDDGSKDWETSCKMVAMSENSGSTSIVATPHIIEYEERTPWEKICAMVEELQQQQPGLKMYPGSEVMMHWDILEAYKDAPGAYCLNGTRYALVEMPMYQVPAFADDFWYELQLQGKIPVLAHPERYPDLWKQPERLLSWMKNGMLLQINGGSVLGWFGSAAKQNAEILLKNKMVSFIGSDAHGIGHRNTELHQCRAQLEKLAGKEYAANICDIWPEKLLKDELIYMDVPKKIQPLKEPSFWQKLFG